MTQLMTINSGSTPELLVFSSVCLVYRRWDQLGHGLGKQQTTWEKSAEELSIPLIRLSPRGGNSAYERGRDARRLA